ncbi:M20 family metallopeptidase [uncultured Agrococcus sp.]|uniref:M20 family metallopeptidase n=1 Tax=uncultured Agrococcus sp. TaxID=382258 RepID=UPI0025F72D37|nr:M20 family metallopeptidase [uncultured Agrococcus sp.]
MSSRVSAAIESAKARAAEAIISRRQELLELSARIHANPEVSFEEFTAADAVRHIVAAAGYAMSDPDPSLPTAVRGDIRGTGYSDRDTTVAVLSEYDALEGLGHGCGHNLMAAAGVGAAIGLAAVQDTFGGEVRFLGTPGEERGAGKEDMIRLGHFEGVDAAVIVHPYDRNQLTVPALALEDLEVSFHGEAAHAATSPWDGRNALDAMVQLLASIGLWRQQMKDSARVHGIITEGGEAPNIVPAFTSALFMLRAESDTELEHMRRRFREIVEAAALAHACQSEVKSIGMSRTMQDNRTMAAVFRRNAERLGIEFPEPDPTRVGSTDMGNVSQALPSIHPFLQICDEGTPLHSELFREAAVGEAAGEMCIRGAIAQAQTAIELLLDPDLRSRVQREFATGRVHTETTDEGVNV